MNDLQHILPLLIPIIAIVMGIGIAMLVLWLDFQKKDKLLDMYHKERMLALEHGRELPPLPVEFFGKMDRQRNALTPSDHLRRGLAFLLAGSAVSAALWLNRSPESAAYGLILCAIGLAYLIALAFERRTPLGLDPADAPARQPMP